MDDTLPIDDSTIVVDNTLLSDMVCDTKAGLRHVLGYTTKEEAATLKAGQCIHHAMAAYFLSDEDDPARMALRVFDKTYRSWADENVDPNDRLAWHNAKRCLDAWVTDHPIRRLPFRIKKKYVEQPIAVELGRIDRRIVRFVGILDGAGLARKSSGFYIVDHKSTGSCNDWWKNAQRTTSQFTGYVAAGEIYFGKPIAGVFVNGIALGKLNSSDKKCPKHKVPYHECATAPEHLHSEIMVITRNNDQIRTWKETALRLTRDYLELRESIDSIKDVQYLCQQGTFRYHCNNCEFKKLCEQGRTPHAAKMLLRLDRWNPEAHGKERHQFALRVTGRDVDED